MLLEIDPIIDSSFDCLENTIRSIAKWKNIDFEMMFINSWNYEYLSMKNNRTIGENLILLDDHKFDMLNEYHGFQCTYYPNASGQEIYNMTFEQLEKGYPIAVSMNYAWCPWAAQDNVMNHDNHLCLIVGYDNTRSNFYCIDFEKLDSHQMIKTLACNHVILGANKCNKYNIENYHNKYFDYKKLLQDCVGKITVEQLIHLKEDILNMEENDDLSVNYASICEDHLITQLNAIGIAHEKFSLTLRYISERFQDKKVGYCAQLTHDTYSLWLIARGALVKGSFNKRYEKALRSFHGTFEKVLANENELISTLSTIV